jgi:hypothetical protein
MHPDCADVISTLIIEYLVFNKAADEAPPWVYTTIAPVLSRIPYREDVANNLVEYLYAVNARPVSVFKMSDLRYGSLTLAVNVHRWAPDADSKLRIDALLAAMVAQAAQENWMRHEVREYVQAANLISVGRNQALEQLVSGVIRIVARPDGASPTGANDYMSMLNAISPCAVTLGADLMDTDDALKRAAENWIARHKQFNGGWPGRASPGMLLAACAICDHITDRKLRELLVEELLTNILAFASKPSASPFEVFKQTMAVNSFMRTRLMAELLKWANRAPLDDRLRRWIAVLSFQVDPAIERTALEFYPPDQSTLVKIDYPDWLIELRRQVGIVFQSLATDRTAIREQALSASVMSSTGTLDAALFRELQGFEGPPMQAADWDDVIEKWDRVMAAGLAQPSQPASS